MHIHEYQAKDILKEHGIPVPNFRVVSNSEDAEKAIKEMGIDKGVVKVMVHAGGRCKAGGVKITKTSAQTLAAAKELLGMKIVNAQTGPEGVVAHQVLIAPLSDIEEQYYVGCVIDRERAAAMLIVSPEGGVDIEEIAAKHPEKILTVSIGSGGTLRSFQLLRIAKLMGWTGDLAKQGEKIITGVAKAFCNVDASLLEINPLALTGDGRLLAIDAKCSIDDNALFRHPKLAAMFDPSQLPQCEVQAKEQDLSYIALEGNIGCMVNGAGLAMATMDIIKYYGGMPANFLDVGGGASEEKIAEGFRIILSDPHVKAILINIFGGIMNCVTLAAGIVAAVGEQEVGVPLVVRMEGTNVEHGKRMLMDSGLDIIIVDSMAAAADQVVACTKES